MESIGRFVTTDDDIGFEYELQVNPNNETTWRRYLESWKSQDREKKPFVDIVWLYERFCVEFPRHADVWEDYIKWAIDSKVTDYRFIADLFKRGLANVDKGCEKLCLMFLSFAIEQSDLSIVRRALDECLKRLSHTAHAKVWELVLRFIYDTVLPLTKTEDLEQEDHYTEMLEIVRKALLGAEPDEEHVEHRDIWSAELLKRYLEVCPHDKLQDTLAHLAQTGDQDLIYLSFNKFLGRGSSFSPDIKLPYDFHRIYLKALQKLRKLKNYKIFSEKMQIIFPKQKAKLLIDLVKFYLTESNIDAAKSLLDESLESTVTAADFSQIYNFYLNYEKASIEIILTTMISTSKSLPKGSWELRLEKHMNNLKVLTDDHLLKLNDVKLRQDSNSIDNWLERVSLFESVNEKCNVLAQALLEIDPAKVNTPGALGRLWCQYAKLYWEASDYDTAREVWDRSLRVPYSYLEDLEIIWLSWAEHELLPAGGGVKAAIRLLEIALKAPEAPDLLMEKYKSSKRKIPAQGIIFSSVNIWSMLLDLEESTCSREPKNVDKTIEVYEQAITLKAATPLTFINYAHFLQDYKNISASFQIYERAMGFFPPETRFEIWNIYLAEATKENAALSNEQIRDIFDKSLEDLKPEKIDCKSIFISYSGFEERVGFMSRSVDILLDGCRSTESIKEKIMLWHLCLSKAQSLLGKNESRKFYEECIKSMPNSVVVPFVIEYAVLEASLGEKDRTRGIFSYGAQLLPPSRNDALWEEWDRFEVENGNKETYKEMLILKRKLQSEMHVDTEFESRNDGNVEFVVATQHVTANPEEIELDL